MYVVRNHNVLYMSDKQIEDFLDKYYDNGYELLTTYEIQNDLVAFVFKLRDSRQYVREDDGQ